MQIKNKTRYELTIDAIDIPEDAIDLFKVNNEWQTNNPKAINWLVEQIKAKATTLVIDVYTDK